MNSFERMLTCMLKTLMVGMEGSSANGNLVRSFGCINSLFDAPVSGAVAGPLHDLEHAEFRR